MTDARAGRRALFAVLFFLSGAAGLVYEQIWIRELQQFFGSTIHSITTVVAAYMGGLGFGAWLLGRRADHARDPARLYGLLEIAIGVFGLLSPWVFRGVGAAYLVFARAVEPGLWTATVTKFVAAFTVMLVPTFLMGGTLPVLTRAFAGPDTTHLRRELARFYGLNTVGAVLGCALAGYVLVEHAGLWRSLVAVGVLNLALGSVALSISSTSGVAAGEPAPELAPALDERSRRIALQLIGVTAFASLLYEIAWTRVLVLVVGSSTYAFTTILTAFLLGIGAGSLVAVGDDRDTATLLRRTALTQGGIAVTAALLFPFFRMLPVYIVTTLRLSEVSATALLIAQALPIAMVVAPPAFGMGLAFPLLAELAARRDGGSGGEAGRAYFANTIGSIAGAAVTGFVLIHTIGSERTLVLGVTVNAVAAAALVWRLAARREMVPGDRAPLLLGALAMVLALATPDWSRRLLDRGPAIYGHDIRTADQMRSFLRATGAEQQYFAEGWNAAISVWRNGSASWLKANGKADASTVADMDTQVLVGLLPALAQPRPTHALIIGLGSGVTARTVADVPGVEHIDVVEIERAVVRAQPYFAEQNRGVLADPRVRLVEDDARGALQIARRPYDLIVSEPTNPWIAGVASLFTPEFFRVVRGHLAHGGVFGQWLQTYRVPMSVVATVAANLRSVFPYVEMWYANPADLIVLASNQPIHWDAARASALADTATPSGRALRDWGRLREPSDLLGRFLLGPAGMRLLASRASFVHRDDQPALEFVAARGLLVRAGQGTFDSLLAIKVAAHDTVPAFLDGWNLGPGELSAAYARMLPSESPLALTMAEAATAASPREPALHGVLGTVLYERSADTDTALRTRARRELDLALRGRPDDARLLLRATLVAVGLGDTVGVAARLERARSYGGDSVLASSLLASHAAQAGDYRVATAEATRALRGLRPTLVTPFPGSLQEAVHTIAYQAPPELAVPVLILARTTRPGWDLAYIGGAVANARWGGAHCRDALDDALELERFGWDDKEILDLVPTCVRRGATATRPPADRSP